MAVVKDTVRPLARDRPSFSSSLPRQPTSFRTRTQSATCISGDKNRISRRRGSNMASVGLSTALQAAAAGIDPHGISVKGGSRSARNALGALNTGVYPSPGDRNYGLSSSAIVEGPPMSAISDKTGSFKIRRASDSTQKIADSKRRGAADLQCEHCGKMYKHHSCLTKHLWEHTPEWGLTSKLLISKHQQVQLLEAASVLLAMNADGTEALMNSSDENADNAPSPGDDIAISSADEDSSPPPPSATTHHLNVPRKHRSPISSTGYSNSYQSVFSSNEGIHVADSSSDRTPATSYNDGSGEDHADLAAAVGLLSCSYGTSASQSHGASHRESRPAMPAVPQQYQSAERHLANKGDVEMKTVEDEYWVKPRSFSRVDEDEGVFGLMEE